MASDVVDEISEISSGDFDVGIRVRVSPPSSWRAVRLGYFQRLILIYDLDVKVLLFTIYSFLLILRPDVYANFDRSSCLLGCRVGPYMSRLVVIPACFKPIQSLKTLEACVTSGVLPSALWAALCALKIAPGDCVAGMRWIMLKHFLCQMRKKGGEWDATLFPLFLQTDLECPLYRGRVDTRIGN